MKRISKRKGLAVGSLILLLWVGGFLVHDHIQSQSVDNALRPCSEAMHLNPNSGGLPCYQAALRAYPDSQALQIRVATNLVCLGRFDEARPLYKKAASEFGWETSQAKKMLQPGAMQQWKASTDNLMQGNKEYTALNQKHGQEEIAFKATHSTSVEPYKTQFYEMSKAHEREEREMMIAKGVWSPSVLNEPLSSTSKH